MRSNIFLAFFLVLFFVLVLFRYAPLPRVQHDPVSPAFFAITDQNSAATANSLPPPAQYSMDAQHEMVDLKPRFRRTQKESKSLVSEIAPDGEL
ncbi:hypothetical protein [Gynuella sp.]|uniref:hypothetical protein n=1 Tax=Gynuella sp. TaxID=2969146 RepID=UPI003D0B7BFA